MKPDKILRDKIKLYRADCMDVMKNYPDNYFDLAIVDPPYGLGDRLLKGGNRGGMRTLRNLPDDKVENWDDKIPPQEYFSELQRVSKKKIIWGGNYFLDHLGKTDGFIVWDKMNGTNALADAELAWQNIKGTTRIFRWHHFSGNRTKKIHPTQKPIALYRWIYENYSKQGQRILDTHLGSGSNAIAGFYFGVGEFVGIELDEDYFIDAVKRIDRETRQKTIFQDIEENKPSSDNQLSIL